MTKKNKYLLSGLVLFLGSLAMAGINIWLAWNANTSGANREALGMLFYWSMFLAFPMMIGVVLIMFALWGNKPK